MRPGVRELLISAGVWGFLALAWLYFFAPSVTAPFWIIDDHSIPVLVAHRPPFSWATLLAGLESFGLETNGRFRPLYHFFLAFECWIFADLPLLWHVARMIFALACFTFLFVGCRRWTGPLQAGVCASQFLVGPQTIIWIRLGPAEAYSTLFACFAIMWVSQKIADDRLGLRDWMPGLLALVIAGLTKESFIPLLPLAVLLNFFWNWLGRSSLNWLDWLRNNFRLLGLLFLFEVAQVGAVIYVLKTYGHVYHGGGRSDYVFPQIPKLWIHLFLNANRCLPWFAALLFVVALRRRSGASSVNYQLRVLLAGPVFLGLLVLTQMLLYGGGFPASPHYLTPSNFSVVLITLIGFGVLSSVGEKVKELGHLNFAAIVRVVSFGIAVLMLLSSLRQGMATRGLSTRFAIACRTFDRTLDEIESQLAKRPGAFVNVIASSESYECVFSLPRFLYQKNEKSVPELCLTLIPQEGGEDVHFLTLEAELEVVRDKGGQGYKGRPVSTSSKSEIQVLLDKQQALNYPQAIVIDGSY